MIPYYSDNHVTLYHGDCLDVLATLPDASVDSVVTDPPYELGFMGKGWDATGIAYNVTVWRECLRVLKPGGHLLAFGGSRTWHRLAVAVEDAGFELRDSIAWLYGSGFPKSLDVSKAIDKARDDRDDVLQVTSALATLAAAAGISRADIDAHMGTSDMGGWWLSSLRHRCACPSVENWTRLRDFIPGATALDDLVWKLNGRKGAWGNERDDRRVGGPGGNRVFQPAQRVEFAGTPATDAAERWQGWGTALKPAFEPVVVARKPLEGTVAANVLAWGTGALNIDACRVESDGSHMVKGTVTKRTTVSGDERTGKALGMYGAGASFTPTNHEGGRWPANVVLDEHAAAELDRQSGWSRDGVAVKRNGVTSNGVTGWGTAEPGTPDAGGYGGQGGASRFFPTFRYEAKAPTSERPRVGGVAHPTVKPLDLMRWLVRLATPPGGTVLDLFAGSGTTGEACVLEGFACTLIEREADYMPLIVSRLDKPVQLGLNFEEPAS